MTEKRDTTALIITICAVITAMPRWIGALLAAEGFVIPADWLGWWIVASAIFNAAMAVTEGLAFAYVFNAWRTQRDKSADRLLWFAAASGLTFVIVLAPFIAAQVRASTLASMLSHDAALWIWSAAVAASTIVIVASVGYAQKRTSAAQAPHERRTNLHDATHAHAQSEMSTASSELEPALSAFVCADCERTFSTKQALSAHKRFCVRMVNIEVGRNGNHRTK